MCRYAIPMRCGDSVKLSILNKVGMQEAICQVSLINPIIKEF